MRFEDLEGPLNRTFHYEKYDFFVICSLFFLGRINKFRYQEACLISILYSWLKNISAFWFVHMYNTDHILHRGFIIDGSDAFTDRKHYL